MDSLSGDVVCPCVLTLRHNWCCRSMACRLHAEMPWCVRLQIPVAFQYLEICVLATRFARTKPRLQSNSLWPGPPRDVTTVSQHHHCSLTNEVVTSLWVLLAQHRRFSAQRGNYAAQNWPQFYGRTMTVVWSACRFDWTNTALAMNSVLLARPPPCRKQCQQKEFFTKQLFPSPCLLRDLKAMAARHVTWPPKQAAWGCDMQAAHHHVLHQ